MGARDFCRVCRSTFSCQLSVSTGAKAIWSWGKNDLPVNVICPGLSAIDDALCPSTSFPVVLSTIHHLRFEPRPRIRCFSRIPLDRSHTLVEWKV